MQQHEKQITRRTLMFWAAAFGVVLALGWLMPPQTPPGCQAGQLTKVPDAGFAVGAAACAAPGTSPAPAEKLVCLTFDDGPSKNTPRVLEILSREGVPATFFVIAADNNQKHLPLIADEAAAGHQIALHSASHDYRTIYHSPEAFWQDIDLLKQRIAPYVDPSGLGVLRFPGGSTNTISRKYGGRGLMKTLKAQAAEKGLTWLDWNVCAGDAVGGHPSAAKLLRNVKAEAEGKDVCVVLMHDTALTGTTVEALPDIIDYFRTGGYRFCTVDEMLRRQQAGPG